MKEFITIPTAETEFEALARESETEEGAAQSSGQPVVEAQAGQNFVKETLAHLKDEIEIMKEEAIALTPSSKLEVEKSADELSLKGSEGYLNSSEYVTEIERKQRNWVHKMLKSKTFRVSAGAAVLLGGAIMTLGGVAVEEALIRDFDKISAAAIEQIKQGQYAYPAKMAAWSAGAYKVGEWGYHGMGAALKEFTSVIGEVVRKQRSSVGAEQKPTSQEIIS